MAPDSLIIRTEDWNGMLRHVRACLPDEACGLLGGTEETVRMVIAVTNEARSPVTFRMEPREQLKAMLLIEEAGYELLGIYHSHPAGPQGPSQTDLAEAYYPDVAYLIWYRAEDGWRCSAYDLGAGTLRRIPISLIDESGT